MNSLRGIMAGAFRGSQPGSQCAVRPHRSPRESIAVHRERKATPDLRRLFYSGGLSWTAVEASGLPVVQDQYGGAGQHG